MARPAAGAGRRWGRSGRGGDQAVGQRGPTVDQPFSAAVPSPSLPSQGIKNSVVEKIIQLSSDFESIQVRAQAKAWVALSFVRAACVSPPAHTTTRGSFHFCHPCAAGEDSSQQAERCPCSGAYRRVGAEQGHSSRSRTPFSVFAIALLSSTLPARHQIVKQEWPDKWTSFIDEIVGASNSSESLCQNNMEIFQLLSEEVFDFSKGEVVQVKAKHLKDAYVTPAHTRGKHRGNARRHVP